MKYIAPVARHEVPSMEEALADIEFMRDDNGFVARIQSALGGTREYRRAEFESVLRSVIRDLQEEFEGELQDHGEPEL